MILSSHHIRVPFLVPFLLFDISLIVVAAFLSAIRIVIENKLNFQIVLKRFQKQFQSGPLFGMLQNKTDPSRNISHIQGQLPQTHNATMSAANDETKLRKRLEVLLKLPENQICADCRKRGNVSCAFLENMFLLIRVMIRTSVGFRQLRNFCMY